MLQFFENIINFGNTLLWSYVLIVMLSKITFAALDDYAKQRKTGKNPVFNPNNIPGLKNVECWGSSSKHYSK